MQNNGYIKFEGFENISEDNIILVIKEDNYFPLKLDYRIAKKIGDSYKLDSVEEDIEYLEIIAWKPIEQFSLSNNQIMELVSKELNRLSKFYSEYSKKYKDSENIEFTCEGDTIKCKYKYAEWEYCFEIINDEKSLFCINTDINKYLFFLINVCRKYYEEKDK